MICKQCWNEFEYDDGIVFDSETFVCLECMDELETQRINWEIKNK